MTVLQAREHERGDIAREHERGDIAREHERGDIVIGWLVRLVVVLAVFGVVAFDGISCALVRWQAGDAAEQAAQAGADAAPVGQRNPQLAYNAATAYLAHDYPSFTIDPASVQYAADGSLGLTLHATGGTLVLHYVPRLRDLASVTTTASATHSQD